jgi:hypothetical protein
LDEVLHVDARGALEAPWSPFISFQGKVMRTNIAQAEVVQPFMKLAQSNMELWSKFSQSPEVMSEATRNMNSFFEQAQTSATSLARSHAFTGLMQGMVKNYTDFVSELTQSAYAMMSQGQATFLQQTQEATAHVIDAADARSRRPRQAA